VFCCLSNRLDVEIGGAHGSLDLHDALVLEQDVSLNVGRLQPAEAWLIELIHI
jgi:hypothetical protein